MKKNSYRTEGYKNVRYFTPASLTASQTPTGEEVRARKRQLNTPLTYQVLIDEQARKVLLENLNEQTAANRTTALRGFLRASGLSVVDIVGDEMRMRHPEALERFAASMLRDGRSARSITNSRCALRPWKEAVVEHDTIEAFNAGNCTPFMEVLKTVLENKCVLRVSKDAGIPKDMLWGWIRGKTPRGSSCRYLLRLEAYFGLERNSLVHLSGMKAVGHKVLLGGEPTPIEYNVLIGGLTRIPFCHKPSEDSPLRLQWTELLRYKTVAVPPYRRTKQGKWRFSPCPLTPMTPNTWWTFLDGREVASARMAWAKTSAYLGWLGLPPASGGMAMPREELDTLAWLVVPNYLEKFLDWTATRAGKRNQGTIHFLGWIAAHVRPRTGYLRQRPELLTTLPAQYHFEDWENLCHRQFELTEQLVAAYYKEIEVSRDSFAPIKHIIEMRQPMDAIVDMVRRMRADRPISTPWREALWSRDMVLIKLLSCLALRRRNFAHLTWRADNTGDLHQRSDKSWWIRLPKSKFKNTHGAAGEAVYDCQIHPSAWRDIERYLFKDRQSLMRHPTDLLFLTRESGANEQHVPWADLSRRVHVLTANYIPRCAGFGSHAFRHIIATSILKADGGDYKTVAKILNDRVATVEKHYDGLRSNDAAQRMGQLLHAQFAQM